jgi:hypothetical protein
MILSRISVALELVDVFGSSIVFERTSTAVSLAGWSSLSDPFL